MATRDDACTGAVLVVIWLAACAVVDPRADVSLIDDWCYAASVEQLVNGQGFHVSPWSSTFPAVQIWWGALFAWLGGFSFTALRLSTLVLWLGGLLGSYGGLRALGFRSPAALAGTLTLFLYPVGFVLAFSFMTDVPFLALAVLSLWAMIVGLRRERLGMLLLGLGLAVLAFFVRPVAIALPAGLLLGALALPRPDLRRRAALLSLATILVMGALSAVAVRLFPFAGAGGVAYRVTQLPYVLMVAPSVYLEAALSMMAHVGLAIVPVLVGFGPAPGRGTWLTAVVLIVAAIAVSQIAPVSVSALKLAHTISVEELGAARPLLQGAPPRDALGAAIAVGATGLGLIACAVLLGRVGAGLRRGGWLRKPQWACIAGFGLGSVSLCFVLWFFYDRYYLPLVVVALALALADADAAAPVAAWRRGLAVAVLVGFAVLDVEGTRDTLAYARAVSTTAADLRAEGIPEIELDAGYVENGWRLYAHPERLPAGKVPELDVPHVTARTEGLRYVIANGPVPGYRVAQTVEVPTWWAPSDRLYVLEADPGAP